MGARLVGLVGPFYDIPIDVGNGNLVAPYRRVGHQTYYTVYMPNFSRSILCGS